MSLGAANGDTVTLAAEGEGAEAALEELAGAVPRPVRDVLLHRHMREQRVVLEHEPDSAILGRKGDSRLGVEEHFAVEHDPPALGADESSDRAQHGRLPRAGRSEEQHPLPRLDDQVDVADRPGAPARVPPAPAPGCDGGRADAR